MMRYLLDTNTVSEPARPEPNEHVLTRYRKHSLELAIASIVWHELLYGVERLPAGRRRRYLADYLERVVGPSLPVLPYDARAAAWHARERARLEAQGPARAFADGMIAAVAATNDLILVTRNVSNFAGFNGLHVENWFPE